MDLNKACPKDSYPLPSIDALVDNASGCRMLSFLDAFDHRGPIKGHVYADFVVELSSADAH